MANDDDREWTPEEYDKEITRLHKERDQLKKLLDDPEQEKLRRTRRAQIVGEYATRGIYWRDTQMDGIRKVAAETDEGWLFKAGLLKHDGWSHDDAKSNWHPPGS